MSRRLAIEAEEVANAATHGLGLLASLAALPFLIQFALQRGDAMVVIGVTVFGLSLVAAYAASTVYHTMPPGPTKDLWLRIDYAAIYLLIAGTYTPFTLGALRGPWGWSLLVVVWCGALLGVFAKVKFGGRYNFVSTAAYLVLGWLAIVATDPLLRTIGWTGFRWLIAGGLAYTIGVAFFACGTRVRFSHCAWHLCVLAGSLCHVIAVTGYAIRLPR